MNDCRSKVADRHFELELAAASGRESAPDCVEAVLQRLARRTPSSPARRSHRLAAAVAAAGLVPVVWLVATRTAQPPEEVHSPSGPLAAEAPVGIESVPPPLLDPPAGELSALHQAGADAADLAAKRSAERMLEVEREFRARIDRGAVPELQGRGVTILPFPVLTGWTYTQGLDGMPDSVRELDGDEVAMMGFMLPLDEVTGMRRFLLVQSLWSCCYGTPPDLNGIVHVELPEGRTMDYSFEPVAVVGTFRVRARTEHSYVVDIFQIDAQTVLVLD